MSLPKWEACKNITLQYRDVKYSYVKDRMDNIKYDAIEGLRMDVLKNRDNKVVIRTFVVSLKHKHWWFIGCINI